MSIDEQDLELTHRMRDILTYAKNQLPGSIICIFTFTEAEADAAILLNKVCSNTSAREVMAENIIHMLQNMVEQEMVDLTDTNGTMQ